MAPCYLLLHCAASAGATFVSNNTSPPPPPLTLPLQRRRLTTTSSCTNTCRYSHDGECDDGGAGSHYSLCALGTDCNDCGTRNLEYALSLKGVDLKRGEWSGDGYTSFSACTRKASAAKASYFAWTGQVYQPGYCKVLKSTYEGNPNLGTNQGYGYKLWERVEANPMPAPTSTLATSVERGGFIYRTVMSTAPSGSGEICHSDYLSLPAGFHMAPDTSDVRQHIVASYRWSTHIIVLASLKGYRTAAYSVQMRGREFGDSQDKATQNDAGEWTCPWTCYQILVRRSTTTSPTPAPSPAPTSLPTHWPTTYPSAFPTSFPTTSPTKYPSAFPTSFAPTPSPSVAPTATPTASPTTAVPTTVPTMTPSKMPTTTGYTYEPSLGPTSQPTHAPTKMPTAAPSTAAPTAQPSRVVSVAMPTAAEVESANDEWTSPTGVLYVVLCAAVSIIAIAAIVVAISIAIVICRRPRRDQEALPRADNDDDIARAAGVVVGRDPRVVVVEVEPPEEMARLRLGIAASLREVELRSRPSAPPIAAAAASREGEEENLCCICLVNPPTHAFVPCGHRCVCAVCTTGVMDNSRRCPICRTAASGALVVYG